jgi:hypothetical protein
MAPSMLNHDQFNPFRSSYNSNPIFHNFSNTPAARHSWKRRCAVELEQMPLAFREFHWAPVREM